MCWLQKLDMKTHCTRMKLDWIEPQPANCFQICEVLSGCVVLFPPDTSTSDKQMTTWLHSADTCSPRAGSNRCGREAVVNRRRTKQESCAARKVLSAMALTPMDMLSIQAAIDAYEKRFPGRPSPSAEEALSWLASKRRVKSRYDVSFKAISAERGAWPSAWERLLIWWHKGHRMGIR